MPHSHQRPLLAGMEDRWAHKWRYDSNGQVFVRIQGRWWQILRPMGTKMQLVFADIENRSQSGLEYAWTPPDGWPMQEVCCLTTRGLTI